MEDKRRKKKLIWWYCQASMQSVIDIDDPLSKKLIGTYNRSFFITYSDVFWFYICEHFHIISLKSAVLTIINQLFYGTEKNITIQLSCNFEFEFRDEWNCRLHWIIRCMKVVSCFVTGTHQCHEFRRMHILHSTRTSANIYLYLPLQISS